MPDAPRLQGMAEEMDLEAGPTTSLAELQADFATFMQKMLHDSKRAEKMARDFVLTDARRDPLAVAEASAQHLKQEREKAARARGLAAEMSEDEARWLQQVRQNQAQRCAAVENSPCEVKQDAESDSNHCDAEAVVSPMSSARALWRAHDQQRLEEAAEHSAARRAAVAQVNDAEWMPRFETHRRALREQRRAEEQQRKEVQVVEAQWMDRERQAMLLEEDRMREFLAEVHRACQDRASRGINAEALESACRIMLAREEPRSNGCEHVGCELAIRPGRGTKSKALQSALELATAQQQKRDREAPEKAEMQLWDTMLARNRLKLKQERNRQLTPRWGLL